MNIVSVPKRCNAVCSTRRQGTSYLRRLRCLSARASRSCNPQEVRLYSEMLDLSFGAVRILLAELNVCIEPALGAASHRFIVSRPKRSPTRSFSCGNLFSVGENLRPPWRLRLRSWKSPFVCAALLPPSLFPVSRLPRRQCHLGNSHQQSCLHPAFCPSCLLEDESLTLRQKRACTSSLLSSTEVTFGSVLSSPGSPLL